MERERLEVWPEWGAFPLWDERGEADDEAIGLSPELRRRMVRWNRAWEGFTSLEEDRPALQPQQHADWVAEGHAIVAARHHELGCSTSSPHDEGPQTHDVSGALS